MKKLLGLSLGHNLIPATLPQALLDPDFCVQN